jgi:uncharacterized protein YpmS
MRKEVFAIARFQPRSLFRDRWRLAFFALALLVLLALIALWSAWVFISTPATRQPAVPQSNNGAVQIEASVSLDSINQYIALQLSKKETPVQSAKFSFEKQRMRADISISFFGRAANLSVW